MEQALRLCEGEVTPVQAHAYIVASQLSMRLGNLDRAEILVEQGIQSFQALGDRANLATSLRAAGWIAHQKSQIAHAYHLYEQALALYKQLHDKKGIASTMLNMAFIRQTQGDYEQARALLEEVVIQHRALNNKAGLIGALYQLAQVLFGAEERYPVQRIRSLLDEGLELAQELGDRRGEASMQGLLGWIVGSQGHLAQARSLIEDCLRFYKQGGDREITGHYLAILAGIVTAQGDYAAARSLLEESLAVGKEIGSKTEIIAVALEGMAELALAQADRPWAVRLWGAAAQWREASQFSMLPSQRLAYEHRVQEVRQFLGKKAFTTLWDDGRTLTLDEVWPSRYRPLPYQHEIVVTPPQSRQKSSEYPAGLSAREVEVLCLVAQGLSDAQIAEQLIIGTRTINTHLTSIYHKLGVNSRSAAVRFAAEHQLL